MQQPSPRLIAEIEAVFEESDPYAIISEVLDDPDLTDMMEGYADSWRVIATGEVHVTQPCLPYDILDLWSKSVMVPLERPAYEDTEQPRAPLTAADFVPAYALTVNGGLEITAEGDSTLAVEIKEAVSDIAVRLISTADPEDPSYLLTDSEGRLLNRFTLPETLVILASLASEKPVDFEQVSPLAQCAVMLERIGNKFGASSEEFRTVAPLIPDQAEEPGVVSGAVVYARHNVMKSSAVTTAIERLVKYEDLDTDVLYRMLTGHFALPAAEEEPLQRPTFIKTLASPAAYEVKNIDATEPGLSGTSYYLPADHNTLQTFTDTVQQIVASAAEKRRDD